MQEYARIYKHMQEYARVCRRIKEYAGENKSIQEYVGKVMQENTRVYRNIYVFVLSHKF